MHMGIYPVAFPLIDCIYSSGRHRPAGLSHNLEPVNDAFPDG
jgi:hypothetical protein